MPEFYVTTSRRHCPEVCVRVISLSIAAVLGALLALCLAAPFAVAAGSAQGNKHIEFVFALEDAVTAGRGEFFDERVDVEAILTEAMKGFKPSEKFRGGFGEGFKRGLAKSPWSQRFFPGGGGSYRFLRFRNPGAAPTALFRLIDSSGGLNYHELYLVEDSSGKIRIADIYVAAIGERISESVRRIVTPMIYEDNKSSFEKLAGKESEFIKHLGPITKMFDETKLGNFKAALDIHDGLPVELRDEKNFLMHRLRLLIALEDSEGYGSTVERFMKLYPEDPALDVLLLDYYWTKGMYADAVKCAERLDASLGGDPYLSLVKGKIYYDAGDKVKSRADASRALQNDMYLEDAYWFLITLSLEEKDYKETKRLLLSIERNLGIEMKDLKDIEVYSGFVKSREHKEWLKERGAK